MSKREEFKKALGDLLVDYRDGFFGGSTERKVLDLYDEACKDERVPLASLGIGDVFDYGDGIVRTVRETGPTSTICYSPPVVASSERGYIADGGLARTIHVTKIKETPKQRAARELGVEESDLFEVSLGGYALYVAIGSPEALSKIPCSSIKGLLARFEAHSATGAARDFISISAFKKWAGLV